MLPKNRVCAFKLFRDGKSTSRYFANRISKKEDNRRPWKHADKLLIRNSFSSVGRFHGLYLIESQDTVSTLRNVLPGWRDRKHKGIASPLPHLPDRKAPLLKLWTPCRNLLTGAKIPHDTPIDHRCGRYVFRLRSILGDNNSRTFASSNDAPGSLQEIG